MLSFDLEEFDVPLEHKFNLPFSEQIEVSRQGTKTLLEILNHQNIKATFFSTATFAQHADGIVEQVCKEGHELASHGYYHSKYDEGDLLKSKQFLEERFGQRIHGFRMPRMMPVNRRAIAEAGYSYDSSLNPVFVPGRYNNYFKKRTIYKDGNLWEVPASALPFFRIPLFWLSFHHFPMWFYQLICKLTMSADQYVVIYFHPWEFVDLGSKYSLPGLVTSNSGERMVSRFNELIDWMKGHGYSFSTMHRWLESTQGR